MISDRCCKRLGIANAELRPNQSHFMHGIVLLVFVGKRLEIVIVHSEVTFWFQWFLRKTGAVLDIGEHFGGEHDDMSQQLQELCSQFISAEEHDK